MPEEKWRLTREETLGQSSFITLRQNDYVLPDGKPMDGYYLLEERPGVNVVAITEAGEMLLVRQYRPGIDGFVLECPAGFLEDGDEDVAERARRELREETGYEAGEWQALGAVHSAPHRMRKTEHCYLARNARRVGGQELDETESLRFGRFPLAEVWRMVRAGEITSTTTMAVLLKALLVLQG